MSRFNQYKQFFKRVLNKWNWKQIKDNPLSKIFVINTALLLVWKTQLIPETFLVKNFSFERFNVRKYRWHTFLTYAFSHFTFLSYFFNMITMYFFGRAIQMQFGAKYIWWLYISGALFGSFSMNYFMPYYTMVVPQVGADSSVSAMITFFGLFNLRQRIILFFFLSLFGFYQLQWEHTPYSQIQLEKIGEE